MMKMIFDTHAHYDDHRFDEDREALLASLRLQGVGRVANIAADMGSVKTTYDLARQYDFIYAVLGVHPDGVPELTEDDMDLIRRMVNEDRASLKKVVAIGEIGLDYYWRDVDPELQKKWFERQLILSNELDLPAVIHSRDAAKDTYDMIKSLKTGDGAGIIHCFSYPKEMARQFLDLGYYIALGGVVTFKNGRVAKEVAEYVPADRLLLETDCPYLSPDPFRGQRNDSGKIRSIVPVIAALRHVSEEELIRKTYENANRLYRIEG